MILVTGGAGYIGSHFVLSILNDKSDVIVFDNLELGHIEIIEILKKYGNLKFVKGDLRNPEDIKKMFSENETIDSVVHFAGYSLVEESVKNPQKYYENNVSGTENLLKTMVEFGVKKIVFSSTCATYGEPLYIPIDEKHPQNPINPYGKSKLMIENMLNEYDKKFGVKSVSLRYFNVAGADSQARIGEWHTNETHIIPNLLKSAKDNIFNMYGTDYNTKDGTCVRDYINVEDLVQAHILALRYLQNSGKTDFFNIGTKTGISVKEVFEICSKITGKKIPYKICERRVGDPAILISDSLKAKSILGWESKHDIEYSIKTAYDWEKHLKYINK